jgi:hypothetical protein
MRDLRAARVVAFVQAVTDPGGKEFVAPAERIAVFDNDGTQLDRGLNEAGARGWIVVRMKRDWNTVFTPPR